MQAHQFTGHHTTMMCKCQSKQDRKEKAMGCLVWGQDSLNLLVVLKGGTTRTAFRWAISCLLMAQPGNPHHQQIKVHHAVHMYASMHVCVAWRLSEWCWWFPFGLPGRRPSNHRWNDRYTACSSSSLNICNGGNFSEESTQEGCWSS
jgi:hypothetical protein